MEPQAQLMGMMLTGVVLSFAHTFNCLHEAGSVSRAQAIQSLEGSLRTMHNESIDLFSRSILTGIVDALRMMENGQGPNPLPTKEIVKPV